MGAVRRELEHSNFLAFLLSPTRPHGLGSEALRAILRKFLEVTPPAKRPLRALNLLIGDLDDAVVHRERDNIDVLIELPEMGLVVVIENKIGAKASEGQLERYAAIVRKTYPDQRHLFVFLTPEGADPEHPDYVAVSYLELARTLEDLIDNNSATAHSSEAILLLRHYLEMLRRYVVPDEDLKELALRIYERHREALDFIFECRPEPGSLIGLIRELVGKVSGLVLDRQSASMIRFVPQEWATIPTLNACSKDLYTKTGRNVLFEIRAFKIDEPDSPERIMLSLILGPSEPGLREHLYSSARSKPEIFVGISGSIGRQFATIFSKVLLAKAAARDMDEEQKVVAITMAWKTFLERNLPTLTSAMLEITKTAPVT